MQHIVETLTRVFQKAAQQQKVQGAGGRDAAQMRANQLIKLGIMALSQNPHKIRVIEPIGKGRSQCTYMCQNERDEQQFVLKILPLVSSTWTYEDPEQVEVGIYQMLQSQVEDLPFLYCHAIFMVGADQLDDTFHVTDASLRKWTSWKKKNSAPNYVCICLERANFGTFNQFIAEQPRDLEIFRSLFFQFLAALKILQDLMPGFRHFDLHGGNVLIHQACPGNVLTYHFFGQTFFVPAPYVIRLFDFDCAYVPCKFENKKIAQIPDLQRIIFGASPEMAQTYDVHTFFVVLRELPWPSEIEDFLDLVIPPGFRIGEKNTGYSRAQHLQLPDLQQETSMLRLVDHADDLLTATELLQHALFRPYGAAPHNPPANKNFTLSFMS